MARLKALSWFGIVKISKTFRHFIEMIEMLQSSFIVYFFYNFVGIRSLIKFEKRYLSKRRKRMKFIKIAQLIAILNY